MATALLTNAQWSTGPTMYLDAEYTASRSGANMVYVVKVSMRKLTTDYGRSFGYPIYCDMTLDGAAVASCTRQTYYGTTTGASTGVMLKNSSPSNWNTDGTYYATLTMSVPKTTGSTALVIKMYSGGGTSYPAKTWSFSLPVSAAASESAAKSFVVGAAGTFAITRYSSSFTDTITYSFGSASGTIVSGSTASSVSWTPPLSLLNQMIGQTSKAGTFTVKTYSGSTLVGSNTYTLTLTTATAYQLPIVKVTYARGTGTGSSFVESDSGTTIRAAVTCTIYGSGFNGSLTARCYNNASMDNTQTATINSNGTWYFYFEGYSTQATGYIVATLTDAVGNSSQMVATVSTQEVPLNLNVNLPAVGFGKIAEGTKAVGLADGWSIVQGGAALQICSASMLNNLPSGINYGRAFCFGGTDKYYLLLASNGTAWIGTALNGATTITWTQL